MMFELSSHSCANLHALQGCLCVCVCVCLAIARHSLKIEENNCVHILTQKGEERVYETMMNKCVSEHLVSIPIIIITNGHR